MGEATGNTGISVAPFKLGARYCQTMNRLTPFELFKCWNTGMNYHHFMKQALEQANQALLEGEFPVGCLIVHKNQIIVSGRRMGTKGSRINEIDHAEMVAMRRLTRVNKSINNRSLTLFCTLEPCLMCYAAILLSGIGKLVYAYEDVMGGATKSDVTQMGPLYQIGRISIVRNIMRNESLELLKSFFSNPANRYWKGSILAKYTLAQQ
jgi:tRNA(adenine34) deaminase